jgi:hypothetical protein
MPVVHRPGCWHAGGSLTTLYPDRRTIAGNADAGGGGCGRVLIRGSCGNVFRHPEEAPMA